MSDRNDRKPWQRGDDDEDDRPARRRDDDEDDEFDDDGGGRLTRADLREIAGRQKGILLCILGYFGLFAAQFAVPDEARIALAVGFLALALAATVFVFLLATKVYSQGTGILLGILTLIPLIGLVVLLIINSKATTVLKSRGIHVGLLGARASDI